MGVFLERAASGVGGRFLCAAEIDPAAGVCRERAEEGLFGLTPRQFEVLKAMSHGMSNSEIAHELNLSEVTVKVHISAIFKSMNVTNRLQAIQLAQNLI